MNKVDLVSNDSPVVSIIVITYNHELFIRETLDSCVTQHFNNYEVIVCDDGSSDKTPQMIREYVDKYPHLVIPAIGKLNLGIAENANRGLKLAKGKYIAWLGGDDLMLPDKLAKQVALLDQNPEAVGCVHDAEVFQSETGEVLGLFSEWANGERGLKEGGVELWFKQGYHMLPSTVMFRASSAPKHGLDPRLKYTNDWLFDVEVFQKGPVVVLDEVLGKYRRHSSNVTGSASLKTVAVEDNLMAIAIVEARYPRLSHLLRRKRQTVLLGACSSSWKCDKKKSILYFKSAYHAGGLFSLCVVVFQWAWRNVCLRGAKK